MTFSVTMPALGESVSEGTVTRWLKAEGDHVNVDEPLLEVSTDKVDTEIPSPVSGTLQKIVVQIDQTVPVGAELAIIADASEASAPVQVAQVPAQPATPVAAVETPAPVTPPPAPAAPAAPASAGAGTVITMPALGESVSEGTVTRWLKNVGDSVAVDEALLEVSTDKVDTEIPSPVAGTLLAIDVAVDTTVPVGARLGLIGAAAGAVSAPAIPAPVAAPVAAPSVQEITDDTPLASIRAEQMARAAPVLAALAAGAATVSADEEKVIEKNTPVTIQKLDTPPEAPITHESSHVVNTEMKSGGVVLQKDPELPTSSAATEPVNPNPPQLVIDTEPSVHFTPYDTVFDENQHEISEIRYAPKVSVEDKPPSNWGMSFDDDEDDVPKLSISNSSSALDADEIVDLDAPAGGASTQAPVAPIQPDDIDEPLTSSGDFEEIA